jgi:hypothetical protein
MSRHPALVVGGWALFNAVLVGVLAVFRGNAVETGLYGAAIAIVFTFGAAVFLASTQARSGTQLRQPARSSSMFMLAVACLFVGLGTVFHWWIAAVALYPLLALLVLRRGERLPAEAVPTPVSTSDEVASTTGDLGVLPYPGSQPGRSVPVPPTHPAHGPPSPRRPHGRLARLVVAAAAVRGLFGGRGRRRR